MTSAPSVRELERLFTQRILATTDAATPSLQTIANRHIVDFASVATAGINTPTLRTIANAFLPVQQSSLPARILGSHWKADTGTAILVSGVAGHIHDFDDDETILSIAHVTVPVAAAAWVLADQYGISGKRLLDAYLGGVETMMRLGQLVNPEHYRRGWHATATLGIFGATVASAIALDVDADILENALGFAASMSSGIRSSFGSDGKSLQVAQAARNGYEAVRLALSGLQSSRGMLFGPQGFIAVYAGRPQNAAQAINDYGTPSGLVSPGITIKAYPCCTATHTAIDALLALTRDHSIAWENIDTIQVTMGADLPGILIYDRPRNGLEGKFSMRYCVAAAARFGSVGIEQFTEAALNDPGLQSVLNRVEVIVDRATARPAIGLADHASVSLTTQDGRIYSARFDHPTGSVQRPMSSEMLQAKFLQCTSALFDKNDALQAYTRLQALPETPSFTSTADLFFRA